MTDRSLFYPDGGRHAAVVDEVPPETDLSALALRLIAQAHERENCLSRVLAHWRRRQEKRQRLRQRQELVARGFYDHRLRFTAYRAWRWTFSEILRGRLASQLSDAFERRRWVRRSWRVWRRWVLIRCSLRRTVQEREQMFHRRLLLGTESQRAVEEAFTVPSARPFSLLLSSLLSSRPRHVARYRFGYFSAWAAQAQKQITGRKLLAQWERQVRLTAIRAWSRWTWFIRVPRNLALVALRSSVTHSQLFALWHSWVAQCRLRRLGRWCRAVDATRNMRKHAARARAMECWRRWERSTRLRRIAHSAAVAFQRREFRAWLRIVLWGRKARHDFSHAEVFRQKYLQRLIVRRMVGVARVLLDRQLADHFRDTAIPKRRLVECWSRWTVLCRRHGLLREDERRAGELRSSLLALVAVRRMADAAERDRANRDLSRPLMLPPSAALSLSSLLPVGTLREVATPMVAHERFLSTVVRDEACVVGEGNHYPETAPPLDSVPSLLRSRARHPIPWSTALAAATASFSSSPSPARSLLSPAPLLGGVQSASRSPSTGSQSASSSAFSRDKEVQLRELLSRYKVLMSTADDDERLWAQLSQGGGVDRSEEGVAAQRLQLRQRAETRQMVRSQIAMLQRELRGALQVVHHERY